jgi:hypothetical protein
MRSDALQAQPNPTGLEAGVAPHILTVVDARWNCALAGGTAVFSGAATYHMVA